MKQGGLRCVADETHLGARSKRRNRLVTVPRRMESEDWLVVSTKPSLSTLFRTSWRKWYRHLPMTAAFKGRGGGALSFRERGMGRLVGSGSHALCEGTAKRGSEGTQKTLGKEMPF